MVGVLRGRGWTVTASPQHTLGSGRLPTKEREPPLELVPVPGSLIVPRGTGACPEGLSDSVRKHVWNRNRSHWPGQIGWPSNLGGVGRTSGSPVATDPLRCSKCQHRAIQGGRRLRLQLLQHQEVESPWG